MRTGLPDGGRGAHALLSPSTVPPTGATTPRDVHLNRATPLHQAVISADETQLRAALASHPEQLDWQEEHGYTPLMSAAALQDGQAGFAMARLLVEHGASTRVSDKEGFTCFHWAAAVGNVESLLFLGSEGGAQLAGAKSRAGETALHRACRLGCLPSVAALVSPDMLRAGVDLTARNAHGETPLHVAGAFGVGGRCAVAAKRASVRRLVLSAQPQLRTLVLSHSDCLDHASPDAGAGFHHQEAPGRLTAIMRRITPCPVPPAAASTEAAVPDAEYSYGQFREW